MKNPILYIVALFILSLTTSCTTDSYDKDMEASVIQSDYTATDSTDPIVIPKRD